MDRWDIALLVVVGYLAVMALTRLMIGRRDKLVAQFRRQMAQEVERQRLVEKQRKKKEQLAAAKAALASASGRHNDFR